MLLKDLLMMFGENELVSIVYKCLSNGAYKVEELLRKDDELLLKYVPKNNIDIYVESAGEVVAEDSELRKNEFFDEDKDVAYVVIEVCDEKR